MEDQNPGSPPTLKALSFYSSFVAFTTLAGVICIVESVRAIPSETWDHVDVWPFTINTILLVVEGAVTMLNCLYACSFYSRRDQLTEFMQSLTAVTAAVGTTQCTVVAITVSSSNVLDNYSYLMSIGHILYATGILCSAKLAISMQDTGGEEFFQQPSAVLDIREHESPDVYAVTLPLPNWRDATENDVARAIRCAICLDVPAIDNAWTTCVACRGAVHIDCLVLWVQTTRKRGTADTCPLCRSPC